MDLVNAKFIKALMNWTNERTAKGGGTSSNPGKSIFRKCWSEIKEFSDKNKNVKLATVANTVKYIALY